MKILLENLLRREDDAFVKADDIRALAQWNATANVETEISFMPARVLLQDFTGVPCVVDLAAMRDAMIALGGNPDRVNPLQPVELVIDHSVQVDYFGRADAFALNAELEFSRNASAMHFCAGASARSTTSRWCRPTRASCTRSTSSSWRASCSRRTSTATTAYPDTLVGTDSHTTMVNGLGVLGWGVGGIEAEAAMLGQPARC
jgi:aconitate hydratase